MTDTGWEQWADNKPMPAETRQDMADACVEVLQRNPERAFCYRTWGNTLIAAVRAEDGTIWAWQTEIIAERLIYANP
jgi:hypothetical protein